MAKFDWTIPKEIMDDFKKIYDDSDKIFGEMTKAGAQVVVDNVKQNVPLSGLRNLVKVSVTYKTPTDDGINTKVYISGYLPFNGSRRSFTRRGRRKSQGKYTLTDGVPADFIAKVFEYGTSERFTDLGAYRGKIKKQPFFRKSFKKSAIEKAMLKAQKEYSGGLLDE